MSLTIIVGGQYGGEGKGLITAFLAQKADVLIKIGGPNSAHSFGVNNHMFRVRMVPSGANLGASALVFPAGCLIHIDTLFEELELLEFRGDLFIDPNSGIVGPDTVKSQKEDLFYTQVGSTLTGTGHATSRRVLRRLGLAKGEPRLQQYLTDTAGLIQEAIQSRKTILAEGAQAYGLSNYHGDYPFVSSRDTTAGSVLAQMGIGPKTVDNIILVVKCFPTRNAGGSGFLANELDEHFINRYKNFLLEFGGGSFGVLDKERRIGLFDFDIVDRACIANTPTSIALTGTDRLQGLLQEEQILGHYVSVDDFVAKLETRYKVPVSLMSKGQYITDVIERHNQVNPHYELKEQPSNVQL